MKTLKIKLGFFSLLAVLTASVFLTSCEQEVVNNQMDDTLLNEEQIVLAFQQDENVARLVELAIQQHTTFIEKIEENDVDVEQLKALYIAGDYNTVYTMLNIFHVQIILRILTHNMKLYYSKQLIPNLSCVGVAGHTMGVLRVV